MLCLFSKFYNSKGRKEIKSGILWWRTLFEEETNFVVAIQEIVISNMLFAFIVASGESCHRMSLEWEFCIWWQDYYSLSVYLYTKSFWKSFHRSSWILKLLRGRREIEVNLVNMLLTFEHLMRPFHESCHCLWRQIIWKEQVPILMEERDLLWRKHWWYFCCRGHDECSQSWRFFYTAGDWLVVSK